MSAGGDGVVVSANFHPSPEVGEQPAYCVVSECCISELGEKCCVVDCDQSLREIFREVILRSLDICKYKRDVVMRGRACLVAPDGKPAQLSPVVVVGIVVRGRVPCFCSIPAEFRI